MVNVLRSSHFRLALIYLVVFGVSVLILLGFLYWATVGYMARQTEATIEAEIQGLAEQYRRSGLTGLSSILAERLRYNSSSVYLLTDRNFTPLLGNLGRWPHNPSDENDWVSFRLPITSDEGPSMHVARARQFELRGGFHLLVGRDIQELAAMEQLLIRALTWGLGVTCVLGLAGALTISRGVLNRIDIINQTTRRIMTGDLTLRVPTSRSNDDFDTLAHNLNAMLDRIEQLMEDVRQVSDNIAHDLRTPLTRLRNQLESLSHSASLGDAEKQTAVVAIGEADALLSTFNALLRIARVEAGQHAGAFKDVDIDLIAEDVIDLYEPLCDEKGLELNVRLDSKLTVHGDRDLLFQAIANLLDNAIKYTPAPGRVRLSAYPRGDKLVVEVVDSGPGIAPQQRTKVLQRFYRLDSSRSTPGNGLGLSLVSAVAKLHGATLVLDAEPSSGLSVSLVFCPPVARGAARDVLIRDECSSGARSDLRPASSDA